MATTTLPAGPKGHFLLGNYPQLRRDPLGFLTDCARRYGDFVPIRIGPCPGFIINHPDFIEYVLLTNSKNFIKGPALQRARFLFGNGLVASEGEFWRRQRRLIAPAFHRDRIAAYAEVLVGYADRMLDTWAEGETRDVHAELMRLTLEIVAKALFDADVADDAPEVGEALTEVLYAFGPGSATAILLPEWIPLPSRVRARRATARLDRVIYRIIDERRAAGGERGDLLSMLLAARDDADSGMTDKQLRDEAMTLFLAGHETTAIALSWAFYLLSQRPEVEALLVAELAEALGGRPATIADLPNLPYLEAVVWEALRLYPPAYAVGRQAIGECEIGGYRVPAGAAVTASQWVMHRDPRYFERPEEFHPERWLDGLAKRLPKFAYFPFGGGPRICIGNQFALAEARLVLATVLRRFRLTLAPGQTVVPEPAITLRPRQGMRMSLHRRPAEEMRPEQRAA